ncbi:TonB-dependent receptor, partial [Aegicerativicinus sediminis]
IKAITFAGKEETYQSWYGFDPVTTEYIGMKSNIDENRRFNIAGIQFDDEGNFNGYYDKQVDNYGQYHYQLHWNQRYNQKWSTNFALNYTYGRGYFEEYVDDYLYQNIYFSGDSTYDFLGLDPIIVDGQEINSTDYIRRRWLDNDFYVFNGAINYKDENLQVVGGGSYSLYKGDHFGEIIWARYAPTLEEGDHYYNGYGEKTDTNIFGKATYSLNGQWQFYGDLQVRFVDYTTGGQNSDREPFLTDKQYTFFNPKAGLTYKMNDQNSLYLSYARANREPNRDDFQNNPNVKPEQLNDFELGWRYDSERFRLHSNLYYMHYNEQLVLTGMLDDVGNPIRENSGESYRLGLEIEAAWNIAKGINLIPNIAISSNKNKEFIASLDGELVNLGKTSISYSPNVVFGNALEYSPIENLQIALLSKYVGEQYMGNTDSDFSKLDAYFVNDLNVNYTIRPKSIFKEIVLTALVNNILDERYISNGYYYTYDDDFSVPGIITTVEGAGYYPQAERNFLVGLTLRF